MIQVFSRAHKLGSPVHDSRGRIDPVLVEQLRGYSLADPKTKQQQALPASVVKLVAKATTPCDRPACRGSILFLQCIPVSTPRRADIADGHKQS